MALNCSHKKIAKGQYKDSSQLIKGKSE